MRAWISLFALITLPALADVPAPAPATNAAPATPVAVSTTPPVELAIHPAGPIRSDGSIQDSLGFISIRPVPDPSGKQSPMFQQVEYLRQHGDNIGVIDYLRKVVMDGHVPPPDRARAILEMADCLAATHQQAESLCWLKIWMSLYPARPEVGAVAYRIGSMYMQMGLSDPARDAFYLALAHTVNDGQVQTADDLQRYTQLTNGTLWALAANEYASGEWDRAAQLFARYRKECPTANALSLEKAAFLQADCYYQLKQGDQAMALYEYTLLQHPFNPLAPQARLRLYQLYVLKKQPVKAAAELESLAWTVRTVWPKDEVYWQKQTAQMLLSLNQKNADVLPPLLKGSATLPPEGKSWQESLNHYDALVSYQAAKAGTNMDGSSDLSANGKNLPEQAQLSQMDRDLNRLLPASNQ